MTTIHIPPAALEAGARARWNEERRQAAISQRPGAGRMPAWDGLGPLRQTHLIAETRAAFEAMVKAWPGVERVPGDHEVKPFLVLPLMENPDDKA